MSKHVTVTLTEEQRLTLISLIHSGTATARTLTKARILLFLDSSQSEPRTEVEIVSALLCSQAHVGRTRRQFVHEGLEAALYDKPRPGRAPKIDGATEAKMIKLACSTPPDGHSRWTLRLLADHMVASGYIDSITNVGVYKRLKKINFNLGE
jgi:hypothetical protein